jgi:hypothetical protein
MGFFHDKKAFDRKWTAGDEEHDEALAEAGVSVEAASRVKGRPTGWLVQDVIPDAAVTLVAGEPGAGKTFLACQLAADAARELKARVLLATAGYESTELLRWRLDRADGDSRRVALATLTPRGYTDRRQNPSEESIDERLAILDYTLGAVGDPTSGMLPAEINLDGEDRDRPEPVRLLVIDDLDGWFGKPGNLLSPAALARVIQRLNELARSKRVAIVALARLQLSVEGRITSRQLSRISQAAGVVWLVARDREQEVGHREQGLGNRAEELRASEGESGGVGDGHGEAYAQSMRRWFLPIKNNLASDAAAMGRAFELVEGRVLWRLDETPPTLAEVLLPSVHHNDRRRQRNAAAEWLKEALADGPVASGELYRQAIECGFSKGTVQRAAAELGVKSHKTGFNAGWELRWTPTSVPRGRGAMLKAEGPAFKIYGTRKDGDKAEGKRRMTEREGDGKAMNYGVAVAEDAQVEDTHVEDSQVRSAAAKRYLPRLSEDAQFEAAVAGRNSPHFREGAQLEAQGAHPLGQAT